MNETAGDRGTIGVFLLDDHEIVRRGVRELLEAEPDIKVVGEAGTAASALARIPALRPSRGVLPKPARSSAMTRPRLASRGAIDSQFNSDPPRPCTHTNVTDDGPLHSR